MEWIEADPLPKVCQECQEEDCWECDHAGERWYLSKLDELKVKRKGLEKALERLQRQIAQLDKEIEQEAKQAEERAKKSWESFRARMKEEEGIDLYHDKE